MFTVIGIMFVGIGLGYLLRRQSLPWINKAITALIWLLLFLLGIEVGHNEQIIRSLPTLGVEAFAIAIVCVLGSCLAAWGLWTRTFRFSPSRAIATAFPPPSRTIPTSGF
jgi:uncharacterized membrane protein YbjE (DUF340 family)